MQTNSHNPVGTKGIKFPKSDGRAIKEKKWDTQSVEHVAHVGEMEILQMVARSVAVVP